MLHINQYFDATAAFEADAKSLTADGAREVAALLGRCPAYNPTPLHAMPNLARTLGVDRIAIKDESYRFGLGSFKALGGVYAVIRLVQAEIERRTGHRSSVEEMMSPAAQSSAATIRVVCATDGNHGLAVAAGARLIGCKSLVFVHDRVPENRRAAITQYGAALEIVTGSYDDAVAAAREYSEVNGHLLVSDASESESDIAAHLVMQAYTVIIHEAREQMGWEPTHIFVQAGVGGLAAAVTAYQRSVSAVTQPIIVIVEPTLAACCQESLWVGRRIKIRMNSPTAMAMLECYEPSAAAWPILSRAVNASLSVTDSEAEKALTILAHPFDDDPIIRSRESGAAGLAGFMTACRSILYRRRLELGANSRVLLFNTEGNAAARVELPAQRDHRQHTTSTAADGALSR